LARAFTETNLPALLRYEDRNSMAHSIESRVPFLTPALAELAFSLPEDYLIARDGNTKAIFRQAMRGLVPDAILERKDKIGFATPEKEWLGTLQPWIETVLASDVARKMPVLDMATIRKEWEAMRQGKSHFDFRMWRWLNLIRWAEIFSVTF
jgi:asparagine synthase (glutamine-hydrolysing)